MHTNGFTDATDQDGTGAEDFEEEGDESTKSILELIVHHLSWIIRREPASDKAAALISKTAALQLYRALCDDVPTETLKPLLPVILLPLHQLTDPTFPKPFSIDEGFKSAWKENVAIAHDIVDTLQKRLGSAPYVQQMSAVQADVRARREDRRTKRRIEAVSAPEKALNDKRRRHERTKERRKEKNQMYRERRRGY
jgi:U3 small nucleolar RNA-associated protein 20